EPPNVTVMRPPGAVTSPIRCSCSSDPSHAKSTNGSTPSHVFSMSLLSLAREVDARLPKSHREANLTRSFSGSRPLSGQLLRCRHARSPDDRPRDEPRQPRDQTRHHAHDPWEAHEPRAPHDRAIDDARRALYGNDDRHRHLSAELVECGRGDEPGMDDGYVDSERAQLDVGALEEACEARFAPPVRRRAPGRQIGVHRGDADEV